MYDVHTYMSLRSQLRRARRRTKEAPKEDNEAGGREGEAYLCCRLHHEGMTRMPEEYNGGAKADDQGRGMT